MNGNMEQIKITRFSQIEVYQSKMAILQRAIDVDFDLPQQNDLKRVAGVMLEQLQLEVAKFEEIVPLRLRMLKTVIRSTEIENAYQYNSTADWRIAYKTFSGARVAAMSDIHTERQCICRTVKGYLVIPETEFEDFFGRDAEKRNIVFYYNPLDGKKVEKEFRLAG